jgi:hypothetical protein
LIGQVNGGNLEIISRRQFENVRGVWVAGGGGCENHPICDEEDVEGEEDIDKN